VLGKIPNLQPEWMNEENGIWITDPTLLPDFIADFIQNWLEDNVKPELYEAGLQTAKKYKNKDEFDVAVKILFEDFLFSRAVSFEEQLTKLED